MWGQRQRQVLLVEEVNFISIEIQLVIFLLREMTEPHIFHTLLDVCNIEKTLEEDFSSRKILDILFLLLI